jgi:hypothetical protein
VIISPGHIRPLQKHFFKSGKRCTVSVALLLSMLILPGSPRNLYISLLN